MGQLRHLQFALCHASWLAALVGCDLRSHETEVLAISSAELAPATSSVAAKPRKSVPYPPGSWRRAPRVDLEHTVLWLSQVLIRYEGMDESVSFDLTGWQSKAAPGARTREEALKIAEQVALLASRGTPFAELVRRFSEEPETREREGSLGGIVAGHLSMWPQVLDAVEALEPGAVSRVVATDYGYHVLYRRPAIPEAIVSGEHIVIGHADAPWLQMAARSAVPARSRDEARALTARVSAEARAHPGGFAALVARYSEHRDAARGGDFGSWSTHEPAGYPREIETLAGLAVGEIAEPIETRFGFQIIRRTKNRPRQRYAVTKLQLRFDTERSAPDPASKPIVFQRAQALAKTLQADPARFGPLQQELGCTEVWEVIEGRQLPALELGLARLVPGQIADQPIEDGEVEYLIPKRLDVSLLPPTPERRFTLAGR